MYNVIKIFILLDVSKFNISPLLSVKYKSNVLIEVFLDK